MQLTVLDGRTLNPGDNPWTLIETLGRLQVFDRTETQEVLDHMGDSSIAITNKFPFDAATIDALPRMKMIAVTATGYNVIDTAHARRKGITVSNVPAYSTDSVAQHVFAMLLSFLHAPQRHHDAVISGQWQLAKDFSFSLRSLTELKGKTLGVIGLGKIGRATATVAAAFGMKVIAHSRTETNPLETMDFRWVSQDELFSQSDVISIHCPQTEDNAQFVDERLLALMKPSGILINTARGGLINESHLAVALEAGQLAGALLDVTSTEPIHSDNPLLGAKNCMITPHIAWATLEARRRAMAITYENIKAFLDGSPVNVVS